ncbi:MAG: MBL fold metallo-hydrolase [Crocinitomicaceae bacterium]
MKIEFVNHASVIFDYDNIRLITDPWLEGEVFHDGWSLLSKTQFGFDEFKSITHIWFSHEHPDHFFPPNIKKIPEEIRKQITVLYQHTNDKKVINFCKMLGFKEVIELPPNQPLALTGKFEITNGPFGHDSWLHVKTDQYTFLNTNDCVINTHEKAKNIHQVIGDVDVLLTQFSYASKQGNADQPEKRLKAVEDKYKQMALQFEVFKPSKFIPIASFVWFSHEENFYMNDSVNPISKVAAFAEEKGVEAVVMYPKDIYNVGEKVDSQAAIDKYNKDTENIKIENTRKTVSVTIKDLEETGKALSQQLKKEDKLSRFLLSFYPITFYLADLDKTVKFTSFGGIKEIVATKEQANIIMSSEVLNYCLKFNWGFGATHVNGRFQTNSDKDMVLFNYYVSATESLNHKDSTFKRVMNKLARKLKLKK